MNIDLMRFIDKYVGIPICLLLSIINKFFGNIDQRHISYKSVQRILFLQISEMGSAISAYSSILKVKEKYPDAEIYYFIFKEMQESIQLLNIIPKKNIITVTSKSMAGFIFGILQAVFLMRKKRFDVILDLELFSRLSSILSYLFGGKIRVGFFSFHMEGLYRGTLQTHKVVYNHMIHISQNFLSLVYAIGDNPADAPLSKRKINKDDIYSYKIKSSIDDKQKIINKLKSKNINIQSESKILLINPNASELLPLRKWPIENYSKLAEKILENSSVFVVITGVESEKKDAQMICNTLNNKRCINFAGMTTLRELIDLYNVADFLISNDSGPPNFASLTMINGLVFFGPETPLCYKPLSNNIEALYSNFFCSPCVSAYNHRKSSCKDNLCLKAITPSEVYQKIISMVPGLSK